MSHGTLSAYSNGGCRCAECRAVAREYMRSRREAARGELVQEPEARVFDPGAGYAARRIRAGKVAEFVRWERTSDGPRCHRMAAEVEASRDGGWVVFISAEQWAEVEL